MNNIEIYDTLKSVSSKELNGLVILTKVKKKAKCLTDDILVAQSEFSKVKIRNCISVTTIYDFGITHNDRNSRLNDAK